MNKVRLALFASGSGSNVMNILNYFKGHQQVEIVFVLTNNPHALVVEKAQAFGVRVDVLSNEIVENGAILSTICETASIDYIILAGYLRKIPADFIQNYPQKIINIHPSLLPKFGGKGMYGDNVHKAVLAESAQETGISIHFVNEEFDKGELIAQFSCEVSVNDTLVTLKEKIHALEQFNFPTVIEKTVIN
jgi:phosphoribosylglycinamide formyltransferase-1